MNKKWIRKMQTAAGGPIRRVKFTPEQIAYFESRGLPLGVNNSKNYRKEGVQAQQHQEQEKIRKEQEIASRMEMKPVLVKKASKLGEKDQYKQQVNTAAGVVSPVDPVAEFFMYGNPTLKGVGALAKTGLWNVAKYAPKTQLGNYGRQYFVGNAFKNSFNGAVPTLTSQTTSLLYQPTKQNETGLTSLKFFERPTLSNAQELAGVTKQERNFKPKWHVANYPGYQLKGLMKGSQLEKQLSKNGTININQLNAYFNKASQLEREVANKVLAEKFAGQKTIDYNQFKKAVQNELITYTTKSQTKYSDYGMDRLGFHPKQRSEIRTDPRLERFTDEFGEGFRFRENGRLLGSIDSNEPWWFENYPKLKTFTFESPRITVGNNKHYDSTTLGHSRTYTTPDEPNILHVMESQSDWGQSHVKMMPSVQANQIAIEKALKSGNTNAFHSFTNRFGSLLADKLTKYERIALENINKEIESGQPSGFSTIEDLWDKKYEILKKAGNRSNIGVQGQHLHDNYLQRQLQENLRYAAENGQTKMRYPTSETAAKIEGYQKVNHTQLNELSNQQMKLGEQFENGEISWEEYDKMMDAINKQKKELFGKEYDPKHQTILKKYADFPKLFQKLFKDQKVRTVTDVKGNTWYEVDVPKRYLSREWQFKQGGKMNILEFLKKGSGIHIKKKNRGKFTSYCGGKVTDKCIQKGKNSSNSAIRKRATFAANARKWKHQKGGNIVKMFKLRRYQEGGQTTNNKFDYGQVINVASDVLSTIQQNKAVDASIKNLRAQAELQKKKLFYNNYKSLLGQQLDRSPIVNQNRAYIQANNMSDVSDINQQFLNQEQELLNQKQNNTSRLISSIGGLAQSYFSSLGNKNQISTTGKNDSTPPSTRKTYTTEITKPFNNTADEWRQLIIN